MEYSFYSIAPIVLFPFLAFAINAFIRHKLPREGDWLMVLSVGLSFIWSARIFNDFIFTHHAADYYIHKVFNWIDLSYQDQIFKINLGIYIDNLTAVMLLMVSGVGTLIHLFSTYYMEGDPKYGKFFVYMGLFTSAMLGLVLSDNLLSIFIFWELMGFCSYSLIGFYHEKEAAGNASIKAFMTTRVGDVCFLLGILAIWSVVGSSNLVDIYRAVEAGGFEGNFVLGIPLITFAAFCLFAGTIGKSAQFPLQVWLPDAMMGPTPCSALIHAATMVAAGVYLGLRVYPILDAGGLLPFVAIIGAITAFGAATIALVQTDIKAVLAFSTISQLGYMVLGIGVGAYNAAFMHLITHAVFKACLFLSAGSVIHTMHVQDMFKMGGLRKKIPFTFFAMLVCSFAIAGVPFFSGFVSKDRILGDALVWALTGTSKLYWVVPILGFSAAFLTAFYMFRMMFLTFWGTPRDQHLYDHAHQEKLSFNQNVPLLILSVFTLGLFYSGSMTGQGIIPVVPKESKEWFQTLIKKPQVENFKNYSNQMLEFKDTTSYRPTVKTVYEDHGEQSEHAHFIHSVHMYGAMLSIIIAFGGIFLAFAMYVKKAVNPVWWVERFPRFNKTLLSRYYFDHFYIEILIKKVLLVFNRVLAFFDLGIYDRIAIDGWSNVARWSYKAHRWFDDNVIDNLVDATGVCTKLLNVVLRTLQSGKVQFYFVVLIFVLSGYLWVAKV